MQIQEFDFSVNLLSSLLWQYNNSPKLQSIVDAQQSDYTDIQTDFWTNWVTDVFDLTTANEFGLAVWAIILNIPLTEAPGPITTPVFGFGPFTNGYFNFNNGTFSPPGDFGELTMEEKRFILRLRYFQLTCRGAIPEINAFMNVIVPTISNTGQIYVLDNGGMQITYVFTFTPDPRIIDILEIYDILPRPAGVSLSIVTP